MNVKITPRKLCGNIDIISSKTYAHRILIAAALSDRPTKIFVNTMSEDIRATMDCIISMGAGAIYEKDKNLIQVSPIKNVPEKIELNAEESGSTARFMLPVAAALSKSVFLDGCGRLPQRPFLPLVREMRKNGVEVSSDHIPIQTDGKLKNGIFEIEGNISSQYITGLLMALPRLSGDSEIRLTTPLESKAYVDITIEVLKIFGIEIETTNEGYIVRRGKYKSPGEIKVEGDWSNAAFFIVADKMGGNIYVDGLKEDSLQGDKKIMELLDATEIDAGDIPDLVPILSVLALSRCGTTRIYNASRLRLKESDRLKAIEKSLTDFGGDVKVEDDSVIINGKGKIKGGRASGFSDHRIIMSLAIASLIAEDECIIEGAESVAKSYPNFFEEFKRLGGAIDVI